MFTRSAHTLIVGSIAVALLTAGCSLTSADSPPIDMQASATSCYSQLVDTLGVLPPSDSTDTSTIAAFASAVAGCMQKIDNASGIYCQITEQAGTSRQWCSVKTDTETQNFDVTAFVTSKVPVT